MTKSRFYKKIETLFDNSIPNIKLFEHDYNSVSFTAYRQQHELNKIENDMAEISKLSQAHDYKDSAQFIKSAHLIANDFYININEAVSFTTLLKFAHMGAKIASNDIILIPAK